MEDWRLLNLTLDCSNWHGQHENTYSPSHHFPDCPSCAETQPTLDKLWIVFKLSIPKSSFSPFHAAVSQPLPIYNT